MPPASETPEQHQALREALLAQYPKLQVKQEGALISSHALAAKNVRTLLKARFPKVRFFASTYTYAGGCSMRVTWHEPDDPGHDAAAFATQVHQIADRFACGQFDGMSDSYNYHGGAERQFTDLFGGASYVHCQSRGPLPPAKRAQARAQGLKRSLPAAPRRAGPKPGRM